jgi:hypothetical protein
MKDDYIIFAGTANRQNEPIEAHSQFRLQLCCIAGMKKKAAQ